MITKSERHIHGKLIKTWKNKDNNLCFSFEEGQLFEKKWIPLSVGILFLCVILAEYLFCNSTSSFFLLIFLFMFIFMYWISYPYKDNGSIKEIMMNRNTDLRLHNYLRKHNNDVYEIKRIFYQETKGTYGRIVGTVNLQLKVYQFT